MVTHSNVLLTSLDRRTNSSLAFPMNTVVQNSIRKLTVSYSDTFKCLVNVARYTYQLQSGISDEHSRTRTLLENLLSVIVTHSNVLLTSLDTRTSSSLAFPMNTTDHVNVVLHKSTYSLMSRVTTSHNSIVTAIVNSDAYQQFPLINKGDSVLYV